VEAWLRDVFRCLCDGHLRLVSAGSLSEIELWEALGRACLPAHAEEQRGRIVMAHLRRPPGGAKIDEVLDILCALSYVASAQCSSFRPDACMHQFVLYLTSYDGPFGDTMQSALQE
jgi:hypothetical protein